MIDDQWIREKQAVCDKATAGEWEALDHDGVACDVAVHTGAGYRDIGSLVEFTEEDERFVLTSRRDFPLALAELRRLREALNGLRANHRGWCGEDDPDVGECNCPIGPFNARIDAALGGR